MAEYNDDIDRSADYIDKAKKRETNKKAKYYSLDAESERALKRYKDVEKGGRIKITKIDLSPGYDDCTPDSLMEWLVWTGWVDAYIKFKMKNGNDPDYEDYRQTIWIEILSIKDRLHRIYCEDGKPSFLNYIKMICNNQIISKCSRCYTTIRRNRREHENYFNAEGWNIIDENWNPEEQQVYNTIEYTADNPWDEIFNAELDEEQLDNLVYVEKKKKQNFPGPNSYDPKELEPYIIEYGPDLKRLVNDAIIDIQDAMALMDPKSKNYKTLDFILNGLDPYECNIYICFVVLANKKTREMVKYFNATYIDVQRALRPIKKKMELFKQSL